MPSLPGAFPGDPETAAHADQQATYNTQFALKRLERLFVPIAESCIATLVRKNPGMTGKLEERFSGHQLPQASLKMIRGQAGLG